MFPRYKHQAFLMQSTSLVSVKLFVGTESTTTTRKVDGIHAGGKPCLRYEELSLTNFGQLLVDNGRLKSRP